MKLEQAMSTLDGSFLLNQRWARPSLDDGVHALLRSMERGLDIRLIATPRDQLVTCAATADLRAVVADNAVQRFDYLPVTNPGNGNNGASICGLIQLAPFLDGNVAPAGRVVDHMRSLSEENLVGADAGILTFMRDADKYPCRLIISGKEIVGLVSLSDLQRLPVRPVLFMLITHLELLMTYVIRKEFGESDAWKARLSHGRRKHLETRIANRRGVGMDMDPILMTEFCDKATVVAKQSDRVGSRKKFLDDMSDARELRDAVAHANDFAATPADARKTCATVRIIEEWIDRLRR